MNELISAIPGISGTPSAKLMEEAAMRASEAGDPTKATASNREILDEDSTLSALGTEGLTGDGSGTPAPAFGDVISSFLGNVNAAQIRSDELTESMALGEPVDIHQVMLSLNEASNALSLTLQVRSHVLKAYQDLMQLPL